MDLYEVLPQKLSCEDLLIEVIKLWPPPIKDMVDHPHKFLVLFLDANGMQDLYHMKLYTKNC